MTNDLNQDKEGMKERVYLTSDDSCLVSKKGTDSRERFEIKKGGLRLKKAYFS